VLKLNYSGPGQWLIPGTSIYLDNFAHPGVWQIECWEETGITWLERHGLLDASDSTRKGLLTVLAAADQIDPAPRTDDEYCAVRLIRQPDGSYTEKTGTFTLARRKDSAGDSWWFLSHDAQDLPGGSWSTSERTLRKIRKRINLFYEHLAKAGVAVADAS
jgi:hypothetical protein